MADHHGFVQHEVADAPVLVVVDVRTADAYRTDGHLHLASARLRQRPVLHDDLAHGTQHSGRVGDCRHEGSPIGSLARNRR